MKRKHRWTALVLVVALIASAIAPASALASRSDRPSDLPDGPGGFPMPLEYGDPDPGNGSPMYVGAVSFWRQMLFATLTLWNLRPRPTGQESASGVTHDRAQSARGVAR